MTARTDHYRRAEELLDSYNPNDKVEAIGHAILALVDELSVDPNEKPVSLQPADDGVRSWQR